MSTESNLWSYLRDHLPGVDFVRVENSVGPGTPDVNFCYTGTEGWWELKYRHTIPQFNSVVFPEGDGLRREQKPWIDRRWKAGGNVFIVAGIERSIYFIPGAYAFLFNTLTIDELRIASQLIIKRGNKHFELTVKSFMRSGNHDARIRLQRHA